MNIDPQDTRPEDWHAFEAERDIRKDGVKTSLVNAIDQLVKDSIACFACNCLGQTHPYDPKVGVDFSLIKIEKCLETLFPENKAKVRRTVWTVKPVDGVTLNVGDVLAPMKEFPDNDRLIRCRRQGQYPIWCHIEGDGAAELMKYPLPLPWLEITEVSEISGFGKAVIRGD